MSTVKLLGAVVALFASSCRGENSVTGGSNTRDCRWHPAGPLEALPSTEICSPIVDDLTGKATGSWAPWTRPPVCKQSSKPNGPKYCAFTYSPFRGHSELSITTTPEIAADFARLLEDPDPRWIVWNGTSPLDLVESPYDVVDVPGMGKGAVANRKISKGEIVLREFPMMADYMQTIDGLDHEDASFVLQQGFEQLSSRQQARILDMARKGTRAKPLEDVFETNNFGVMIGDEEHAGMFPEVARLNHACQPNCFIRYSRRLTVIEIVAYKDIEPGEELTLSYLPLNMLSNDRQSLLQRWGFNCSCSLCSSPEKVAASDRNRNGIQEVLDELKLPENRVADKVEALVEKLSNLLELEGLESQWGDFGGLLAQIHMSMGEMGDALEAARSAVEYQTYFKGADSSPARRARDILAHVESVHRHG